MEESIAIQLKRITDEYSKKVQDVSRSACQKVSRKMANNLKATSPKRSGEYAASWTVKREGEDTFIVHNKEHYQLTHLLENGHVIRNKYGTYGRAPAYKHIKPAADAAQNELITEIEAKL